MDENYTLESKNTPLAEQPSKPQDGQAKKKKTTPLKVALNVFLALILLGVLGVGAVFGRAMIIKSAGYAMMDDGLVLVSVHPKKIRDAGGAYTVPESFFFAPVVAIGDNAFEGQVDLKTLCLPDTVKSINYRAFSGCYGLESIELSASLEEIGPDAFFACNSLKQIRIPEGVTSISDGAFWQCTSLEYVYLPSTLEYLGSGVFRDCNALKAFVMEKESEAFFVSEDGDLYGRQPNTLIRYAPAKAQTRYVLDRNITHVASYAFDGCTNLESVLLHYGVFKMESNVFINCQQATIFIEGSKKPQSPWSTSWNAAGCLTFWNSVYDDSDDSTTPN